MKSSWFQIIFLIIFGFALVVGVLIFSGVLPGFRAKSGGEAGPIVLWGTLPDSAMRPIVEQINRDYRQYFSVSYVTKNPATFRQELIETLAAGRGPEAILVSQEVVFAEKDKLLPIPLANLAQRTFQDTFIDGAKLFFSSEGAYALPIAVDPLVLYYNKDLYTNAGLVSAPKNWEQFVNFQPKLTVVDEQNNIRQSAVAFGTYSNIANAKDILAMLIMQAGNPIITRQTDGTLRAVLSQTDNFAIGPAVAALNFFLQFSDPAKTTYSWNRSFGDARDIFISGNLANYFGSASDYKYLLAKNPHLNFDLAEVPQQDKNGSRQTFGRFLTVAALKNSAKPVAGIQLALALTGQDTVKKISEATGLAPARRDILAGGNKNPVQQIFYTAAITVRNWFDFDAEITNGIFQEMVTSVSSGREKTVDAVRRAEATMSEKIKK